MSNDISSLASKLRGKFIVLDGPDGAGKTTQHQLLENALVQVGVEVVSCRDPGGTTIGDRIRSVLLDHDLSMMDVNCETLLFMASRAQLVTEVIQPALEGSKTVLCDRFITSTCAYQGAAGYDPKRIIELARYAIDDHWPDLTILFDVEPGQGFDRIGRKPAHVGKNRKRNQEGPTLFNGGNTDAMEARPIDFHRRVRKLFLEVHEFYPTPVVTVDGGADANEVHRRVLECLTNAAL